MQIAVSSFRVITEGGCGFTEAGFTKITLSVLSWIKTVLPQGNVAGGDQKEYLIKTHLR